MLSLIKNFIILEILFCALTVQAQNAHDCGDSEFYDSSMAMCMPLPTKDKSINRLTVQGNGFLTEVTETGNRGRTALYFPNFFMVDLGSTWMANHYLNLDYMGTVERWTIPDAGYPELLQVGEETNQGLPYLDSQHPHSSPIMGLTLSDTWSFGENKNNLKTFFAPRGESTDGPIAFMHRTTGMVNPDAPLGHHIGQDVGHITSTVLGASLKIESLQIEASTFNGTEPQPQNVDLPLGNFNSYSFRLIQDFSKTFKAMASYAYVLNPEIDSPDISFVNRYSASIYNKFSLDDSWVFDNTFIWGAISNYDHASVLDSFTEEFLFKNIQSQNLGEIWGRIEALQRTPAELQISSGGDQNLGQWVFAFTLGYTHPLHRWSDTELGAGVSVTNDLLPTDFQSTYNGNPWSGKLFFQLSGMKTWDL